MYTQYIHQLADRHVDVFLMMQTEDVHVLSPFIDRNLKDLL